MTGGESPASRNSGLITQNPSSLEFVCGGCSALTAIFVTFPLHKTIFVQQLQGVRWTSAACQIFHQRPTVLFRGVLPPLCQKTASLSIMFGMYGHTKRVLTQHNPTINNELVKTASATIAGLCEATFMPFERVQTLLQNSNYHNKFKNTFHTVTDLWRAHGFREFYRGLVPVIIRNTSSTVVYFLLRDRFLLTDKTSDETARPQPIRNFIGGALLGAFLGAATYPLNVAKTRIQTQVGGEFVSFVSILSTIYRERQYKLTLLYRGVLINCMRSMVSWGIITMSYDWFRSFFYRH